MSIRRILTRQQIRPTTIEPYATAAAGSVVITQGRTKVLCTASVDAELPGWLKPKPGEPPRQGWVTAEYAMLPGSTAQRKKRGTDSRGTEIQRLIARALRAGVDLEKMPGVAITCDCDVLVADGGTRTASITGAYVALAQCVAAARKRGLMAQDPLAGLGPIAAVSVGMVDVRAVLDLDYELDVRADVDLNVAMNGAGRFVEVQGTGESATFSRDDLNQMLDLAAKGISRLMAIQKTAIKAG